MNYRDAHKVCDAAYGHARVLRWLGCVLLGLALVASIVVGVSERDMRGVIIVPVQCGLLMIAWWIVCTAAMAVAAGMHACVSNARAAIDDFVDADTNCRELNAKGVKNTSRSTQQTAQSPPVQMHQTGQPQQTERAAGQRPGESLEAWAKRMEQAEIAAWKARTKA
jgi:hypothetical protein